MPRWFRPAWAPGIAVAVLLILGMITLLIVGGRWREETLARQGVIARPRHLRVTHSLVGNVGESIQVQAEVLSVDPARGVIIAVKDRAIGLWITVKGSVDWTSIAPGSSITVDGTITDCRDRRNVYIAAEDISHGSADQ